MQINDEMYNFCNFPKLSHLASATENIIVLSNKLLLQTHVSQSNYLKTTTYILLHTVAQPLTNIQFVHQKSFQSKIISSEQQVEYEHSENVIYKHDTYIVHIALFLLSYTRGTGIKCHKFYRKSYKRGTASVILSKSTANG